RCEPLLRGFWLRGSKSLTALPFPPTGSSNVPLKGLASAPPGPIKYRFRHTSRHRRPSPPRCGARDDRPQSPQFRVTSMRFTKMQGAGNDYIYANAFEERLPQAVVELARRIADRHFGVGGDGLILIGPSEFADARMKLYNADGSSAEMCGNGVRCVAKYVYDHGICRQNPLRIETDAGVLTLDLEVKDSKV